MKFFWRGYLLVTLTTLITGTATAFTPILAKKKSVSLALAPLYGGIRQRIFGSWLRREKKGVVVLSPSTSPSPKEITHDQVLDLFRDWNDSLGSGSSDMVAEKYADDAILIPTSMNQPRKGRDSIREYFEGVVKRSPTVTIVDGTITTGHSWATNVGVYEWTFGDDGSQKQARYTFVYLSTGDDEEWKINHHHSSGLPQG